MEYGEERSIFGHLRRRSRMGLRDKLCSESSAPRDQDWLLWHQHELTGSEWGVRQQVKDLGILCIKTEGDGGGGVRVGLYKSNND